MAENVQRSVPIGGKSIFPSDSVMQDFQRRLQKFNLSAPLNASYNQAPAEYNKQGFVNTAQQMVPPAFKMEQRPPHFIMEQGPPQFKMEQGPPQFKMEQGPPQMYQPQTTPPMGNQHGVYYPGNGAPPLVPNYNGGFNQPEMYNALNGGHKKQEKKSIPANNEETSEESSNSDSNSDSDSEESSSASEESETEDSTESEDEAPKKKRKSPVEIKIKKNVNSNVGRSDSKKVFAKSRGNPQSRRRDSFSDDTDEDELPPKPLPRKLVKDLLANCVKNITEISSVGKFQKLPPTSLTHKLIKDYTLNGITAPETVVTVRVHDIFEFTHPNAVPVDGEDSASTQPHDNCPGAPKAEQETTEADEDYQDTKEDDDTEDDSGTATPQASATPGATAQPKASSGTPPSAGSSPGTGGNNGPILVNSKEKTILLWSKATARGVLSLVQQKHGCRAFYDQSSRALAVSPAEVTQPIRQLLLLCKVISGKVEKSPFGYQHWAGLGRPSPGYDTVKAVGHLRPDWENTREVDMMTIPCGKTVEGKLFGALYQNCKRDFNEYYVYDGKRVEIKYAVDVELRPANMSYPKDFSD